MSTRQIPAVTILTCDVCRRDCDTSMRCKEAKLTLKRHAFDYLGNAAADGTVTFDLCDDCESAIASAINGLTDRIMAAGRKP